MFEGGYVYAGCPAKPIINIEEYINKRREKQFDEAKQVVLKYCDRFGKNPNPEILHEYFYLFTGTCEDLLPVYEEKLKLCGNYEQSKEFIGHHKPMFDSFESFIKACHNL